MFSNPSPSPDLFVATAEGLFHLRREGDGEWRNVGQTLAGHHICSLAREELSGTMIAGTHDGGIAISTDEGASWEFRNNGLASHNVFAVAACNVDGEARLYAGTEPAHLYVSTDMGMSWTELDTLRSAPNLDDWTFPPPPHEAHVKYITFDPADPNCIYACVEQGELLRSTDGGKTWEDLLTRAGVAKEVEGDAHRLLIRPQHPDKFFLPTGFGLLVSNDGGKSWQNLKERLPAIGYPDPMVFDPGRQELLFVAGGKDTPGHWIPTRNANASVARSRDGGETWEVVTNGLPQPMTASIEAMMIESHGNSCSVFLGTTDGDVYFSSDDGESWSRIAQDLPPVSKGLHFLLAKGLIDGPPPPGMGAGAPA
ncbi:photosystem II stability/assembly factor-like uncharacterized protein [Altererythrobacter atlanticus]|nr:glycosyl hydrolase [Croceibacterium atlanticum]MBB5731688.1 photosystem II stability/assembly factor-like uncharacterized protein [Croceibacterium atlanticum]